LHYRTYSETAQLDVKVNFEYLNTVSTTYLESTDDSNTFQSQK